MRKILFHYFFVILTLLVVSGCDDGQAPISIPITQSPGYDSDEQEPGPRADVAGADDEDELGPRADVAGGTADDPIDGIPRWGQYMDSLLSRDSAGIGGPNNGGRVPVRLKLYTDRSLEQAYLDFEGVAIELGGCPHCGSSSPLSGDDNGCDVCHAYLGASVGCWDCAKDLADYMNLGLLIDFTGIGGSNSFGIWPNLIRPNNIVEGRNYLIGTWIDTPSLNGWRLRDYDDGSLKSSKTQELLQDAKTVPANGNLIGRKQELLEDAKGLTGTGNSPSSAGSSQTIGSRRKELLDEAKTAPFSRDSSAISGNHKRELLEISKTRSLNTKNLLEQKSFKNSGDTVYSSSTFTGKKTIVPQDGKTRQTTTGRSLKIPGAF